VATTFGRRPDRADRAQRLTSSCRPAAHPLEEPIDVSGRAAADVGHRGGLRPGRGDSGAAAGADPETLGTRIGELDRVLAASTPVAARSLQDGGARPTGDAAQFAPDPVVASNPALERGTVRRAAARSVALPSPARASLGIACSESSAVQTRQSCPSARSTRGRSAPRPARRAQNRRDPRATRPTPGPLHHRVRPVTRAAGWPRIPSGGENAHPNPSEPSSSTLVIANASGATQASRR
jgi:hypothetical protein